MQEHSNLISEQNQVAGGEAMSCSMSAVSVI
nr:MAG TPA: hypothetical protein [Caudoviricetes sp.]DAZ67171.1 MAG TPA: hypothetical protein [Caudoviricetes sp.]